MARTSDRERAGLRGPVKSIVDDFHQTQYDRQGNILSWQFKNPDGSQYGDSYTYDDRGRLSSIVSRRWDRSTVEKAFSDDDTGRLVRIAHSDGETTTFDYDKDGRKTETRILKRAASAVARATGIDLLFADTDSTLLLDQCFGGNASTLTTTYNDRDQPTETQAYDAAGGSLGRILRTYDEKGRVVDVREITDNPLSKFPDMSDTIVRSGVSADALRAQMAKAMKFFGSETAKSYHYDRQGNITEATLSGLVGTFTKTYAYNDYGDVVEEKTVLAQDPNRPIGVPFQMSDSGEMIPQKPPSEWPPQPDLENPARRYSYKYDDHGNWTERSMTSDQQPPVTSRRELTYY